MVTHAISMLLALLANIRLARDKHIDEEEKTILYMTETRTSLFGWTKRTID